MSPNLSKKGNDSIRKLINIDLSSKYAPLLSFFDKNGNYKLANNLEEAYRAGVPNQFQKDFMKLIDVLIYFIQPRR